ncbi:hypothetical protein AHAS_Ahas01G0190900 [Arachis hypogaea]
MGSTLTHLRYYLEDPVHFPVQLGEFHFRAPEIRACNTPLEQIAKGETKEEEWGIWLRVDQFGWHLDNQKENKNPNYPNIMREGEKKQKKPIPVSLLKSFSGLSVQEGNSQYIGQENVVQSNLKLLTQEGKKGETQGRNEILEERSSSTKNVNIIVQITTQENLFTLGAKKGERG